MKDGNWTKEETIVAFNVYCKIPFKSSSKNHPIVIQYANVLGRSPSALNMKIGNFGRLDPELKKQGITVDQLIKDFIKKADHDPCSVSVRNCSDGKCARCVNKF
jgi:hypothetical protein